MPSSVHHVNLSVPEDGAVTQGEWLARQRIRLLLEREDGSETAVVLLREKEWVQAEAIEPGGSVYLGLPEQGMMPERTLHASSCYSTE